jgi:hypothetical protein
MTVVELVELFRDAGLLGALVLWIWMGLKKLWVWGWAYDEMRKDRDEWKRLALSGARTAEAAVSTLESK